MPKFKFVAKDQQGQTISETVEAQSEEALIDSLRKKQLIIISVAPLAAKAFSFFSKLPSGKSVNIDDLVVFSRQLATMVDAGLPIVQALDILSEQIEKKHFKTIVLQVKKDVEAGSSLSEAMAKHPRVFSELFVNMIGAGETSGMLDEILDRLASYLEATSKLIKKVRSALVYPAVIIVMATVITLFLLIKVVPTFEGIFSGFGGTLPIPTLILLKVSNALRRFFPIVFGIVAIIGFIFFRYIKTPGGRLQFDSFMLKIPVLGKVLQKVAVSRFSRTLSTLTKSGVSILTALEIVGKTSGNKVVEVAVNKTRDSIKEGESIATPLTKAKVFPPMVVRMISVGEQTGSLEEMLTKIADFYDADVTTTVDGLTSLIEPAVMIFLGLIIGSIVVALYMPIFKIGELIQ